MNVAIAPKPTLAQARPSPGTHTAPITLPTGARSLAAAATAGRDATSASASSGMSVVASATPPNPRAA